MIHRTRFSWKPKVVQMAGEKFVTRGAFDVGTGGSVTWTIASVYPKQAIMRKQIFHSALPLPPMNVMLVNNVITPQGITGLENTFFQIFGRMDEARMRPREMAAIVCEPLSKALNASEVFVSLTRRFLIHFRLADRAQMEHYAHIAYVVAAGVSLRLAHCAIVWTEIEDRVVFFRRKSFKNAGKPDNARLKSNQRSEHTDIWDTKHTAQEVHDLILVNYQNRTPISRVGGETAIQSVNPMSAKEILIAVDDLTKAFRLNMPNWMQQARKTTSSNDRLFCGASANGGTINILSRSCHKTDVDLYTARSNLYGPYVGVTDAFLSRSFPVPHLVLPRLIIAHSLMNALDLRFLRYLPEINPSFGVLVDDEIYSSYENRNDDALEMSPKPMYLDRPWRTISPYPHMSQQIQCPSDTMLLPRKSGRQ